MMQVHNTWTLTCIRFLLCKSFEELRYVIFLQRNRLSCATVEACRHSSCIRILPSCGCSLSLQHCLTMLHNRICFTNQRLHSSTILYNPLNPSAAICSPLHPSTPLYNPSKGVDSLLQPTSKNRTRSTSIFSIPSTVENLQS